MKSNFINTVDLFYKEFCRSLTFPSVASSRGLEFLLQRERQNSIYPTFASLQSLKIIFLGDEFKDEQW